VFNGNSLRSKRSTRKIPGRSASCNAISWAPQYQMLYVVRDLAHVRAETDDMPNNRKPRVQESVDSHNDIARNASSNQIKISIAPNPNAPSTLNDQRSSQGKTHMSRSPEWVSSDM
jgi:hypothetical protein